MNARQRHETVSADEPPPDLGATRAALTDTHSALPALDDSGLDALLPPVPVVEKTTSLGGPLDGPAFERAPRLVVLAGALECDVLPLGPEAPFVMGRLESCDLPLDDEGVSRRHAQVSLTDEGAVLEDLDSRNGTFVGNKPIKRHVLSPDEIIRVGAQTVIKFALMDPIEEEYQRRLLQSALRDVLTGLYNRRHFDERFAAECAAARRHGRPLSLVIFDVDDFKRLNDTHGHGTGDHVLREVARVLGANTRKEDSVFRYGGEEFCFLLRETPLEGAVKAAERRRELVARMRLKLPGFETLKVTVSAGVAEWRVGQDDAEFFARADRALYEAKRAGKNRVLNAP
ncbi:MAG: GGDEF domain-containing protein [Myxococcales bacterium]|nr:GGDEF domain-containing protein [Myxococcales bacterium]